MAKRARPNELLARKEEEQKRVREVLVALGGTPDAAGPGAAPTRERPRLGSRIAAYSWSEGVPTVSAAADGRGDGERAEEEPPDDEPPPPAAAEPRPGPARRPAERDGGGTVSMTGPRAPRPRADGPLPRAGLALLAVAVAAAGAAALALRHEDGGARAAQGAAKPAPPRTGPAPSRSTYPDPRAYAAAMTRLALTSGQTAIDGEPACGKRSTWIRWTCRAEGRPALGAFAGRRLVYRCSPRFAPQPGGRAAFMVDCRPEHPPRPTA